MFWFNFVHKNSEVTRVTQDFASACASDVYGNVTLEPFTTKLVNGIAYKMTGVSWYELLGSQASPTGVRCGGDSHQHRFTRK